MRMHIPSIIIPLTRNEKVMMGYNNVKLDPLTWS